MDDPTYGGPEKAAPYGFDYDEIWNKRNLTPHQLLVSDVRLESWRPNAGPTLEIRERVSTELVPPSAAITQSSRLIMASEAGSSPIESQKLTRLEDQWGWLSHLRLKRIQTAVYDPEDTAVCRWVHISSKFPEYLPGVLWGLSNPSQSRGTAAALRVLDQCIQKQERYSKHGNHFAPFFQPLRDDLDADLNDSKEAVYPMLVSVPFLDWSVSGQTPPLRFQIDKREGFVSSRSSCHLLRSVLQYFYRLEETHTREKSQVFNRHQPWTSDRELDLKIRRWYGHHPTSLVVDELWILAIDPQHVVTFSSNQTWKSRWPPLQLTSRIIRVAFRDARNAPVLHNEHQPYTALTHSMICLSGAVGMLHRSFFKDVILPLSDRYAGYLGHLQYRLHRSPSTKLVMDLLQVQEELNIVTKLMEQQLRLAEDFWKVADANFSVTQLSDSIELQGLRHVDSMRQQNVTRHRTASSHFSESARRLVDNLQRELLDIRDLLENTNTLVNRTVQLVNIRLEDHGKAILVFTIVTIIFLPLNFVSSFFGMNVSDIRNMASTQNLFWIVALCVTAGVVALSVFVAFSGSSIMERILKWKENRQRLNAEERLLSLPATPATARKSFRVLGVDTGMS